MKTYFLILLLGSSMSIQITQSQVGANSNFKLITYKTEDGGTIEASLFQGKKDLVVIFAHGAVFNKESWYFLAEKLQLYGVASLSINFRGYGKSKSGSTNNMAFDILGAIEYLKKQGYKNIALVGGSMGGGAILDALELKTDDALNKVILLSPAGSNGIANTTLKKLFVVSENEGFYARVKTSFDSSVKPKELKIYEGTYHAQHMFKSNYAEELTQLIIEFLIE